MDAEAPPGDEALVFHHPILEDNDGGEPATS
jgi:hypothetical protein